MCDIRVRGVIVRYVFTRLVPVRDLWLRDVSVENVPERDVPVLYIRKPELFVLDVSMQQLRMALFVSDICWSRILVCRVLFPAIFVCGMSMYKMSLCVRDVRVRDNLVRNLLLKASAWVMERIIKKHNHKILNANQTTITHGCNCRKKPPAPWKTTVSLLASCTTLKLQQLKTP